MVRSLPAAEAISKTKKAPGAGLWKPTKLTIVGSRRAPRRLSNSPNSCAFFGHVLCWPNTRATGSFGAGVASLCTRQAARESAVDTNRNIRTAPVLMKHGPYVDIFFTPSTSPEKYHTLLLASTGLK